MPATPVRRDDNVSVADYDGPPGTPGVPGPGKPDPPASRGDLADPGRTAALDEAMEVLDVSGESCPMPLLRTKLALNRLPAGAVLEVIATDPRSERDFQTFAQQSGTALLKMEREGDQFVYLLKKPDA